MFGLYVFACIIIIGIVLYVSLDWGFLLYSSSFFFFKQKTAYEMLRSLVGSEMCIRDSFGTPPSSSYEECEEYLMASHKLDDKQIYVHLLLGDVKYQTKKYGDAKTWYEAATKLEAITPNQKAQQEEAAGKAKKC
eukprot:TRINITY_DN18021_c0_g1_i2.p1 TRINITY_DN18021_c0_g1~~TRINITY_DN18021_c0_g1_i2.p1  ORF type:complete len:135 (+),score=56.23 TRINITY_DN18021_c0_g1_i2:26-430(+)